MSRRPADYWFRRIEAAWDHTALDMVARQLVAEHKLKGVRWFDTLCRLGAARREALNDMAELDAEYQAIVRCTI